MSEDKTKKGRVTGIGGVFFKCDDADKQKSWYAEKLGIPMESWGSAFRWRQFENPEKTGSTAWSAFKKETKYLDPSDSSFMINYRVDDLEAMLERLKSEGVTVVGDIESYDYGKFGWIMDPEGNKIELWEPIDEVYDKMLEG